MTCGCMNKGVAVLKSRQNINEALPTLFNPPPNFSSITRKSKHPQTTAKMMEYFTYKKVKKHQAEKKAAESLKSPLLDEKDETFLRRVISAEGTPPPLPTRPHGLAEAGDFAGNASQMVVHDGNTVAADEEGHRRSSKDKGKGKAKESEKGVDTEGKKGGRFLFITSKIGTKKHKDGLKADSNVVTPNEAASEENDINKVLEDLNLSAVNNRAFSISDESQQVLQKFTVILKDVVNGAPTAYDDLVGLLEDSQGTLAKSYDHLPSFLQKLVTQLPDKLTKNLAPELLAVATEAKAFNATSAGASGGAEGLGGAAGLGAAAMKFLKPTSLKDLVTKPGAVASMLKAIMNALKLRWPAFMGTNVLLSLGLFVLLFVFWYCHKRGREVRLEREAKVDSEGRIIELDDDVMLPGPNGEPSSSTSHQRPSGSSRRNTDREREREHGSSSREHRSRPSSHDEREREREHRSSRETRSRPSSRERERERDREHRHERRERDREHEREREHVERRPTSKRSRSEEKEHRRREKDRDVERERR
ncbi:uncharacterized protein RCO7_09228 [Rhynchosporium graminicola]|uniref:Uncharacterized protein n=1 Tax=Rhynchosporium graminicola TaxID=2792576 RepID=A0A1E1L2X7_9HELO|nr:uncharacterized protein RCO7_09228 [Rhynchosporium commune]